MSSLIDVSGPVLLVHAHPDDETLATGVLAVELARRGVEVAVLTATRGERGEVVPGTPAAGLGPDDMVAVRERELARALAELGVTRSAYLGQPPARATGLAPRRYHDSGMRWIRPGLAGPAEDHDELALTAAPLAEVVADLGAWVEALSPALVISYDAEGTYGHPDHVRCHQAAGLAGRQHGVRVLEVASAHHDPEQQRPQQQGRDEQGQHQPGAGSPLDDGTEWLDLSAHAEPVLAALSHHASQLTLHRAEDGSPLVEHVGGQREALRLWTGLRPAG